MRTFKHLFLVFIISFGLFASAQPQEPVFASGIGASSACDSLVYDIDDGSFSFPDISPDIRTLISANDSSEISVSIKSGTYRGLNTTYLFPVLDYTTTIVNDTTLAVEIDLDAVIVSGMRDYTIYYSLPYCDVQSTSVYDVPPVPEDPGEGN